MISSQVLEILNSFGSKKATGVDQIPPKILKVGRKLYLVLFSVSLIKGFPKIIFLTDWDCVAAVERLPALHYSVDFIFLSFGIMGFIVEVAQVSPIFKKDNPFIKTSYRPVSLLTTL